MQHKDIRLTMQFIKRAEIVQQLLEVVSVEFQRAVDDQVQYRQEPAAQFHSLND